MNGSSFSFIAFQYLMVKRKARVWPVAYFNAEVEGLCVTALG